MNLYTTKLRKFYNQFELYIPKLEIQAGSIFGLVGNNGAGKTTLLRICLDLVKSDEGSVLINKQIVSDSDEWKKYTGAFLDRSFLIDFLTPEEYFKFIASLHNLSDEKLRFRLSSFQNFLDDQIIGKQKYIRELSAGNQAKVGIVAAMIFNPQIVILDEPFVHLDPSSQYWLREYLRNYCFTHNASILISSHDLSHILNLCTHIVILEKGMILNESRNDKNSLAELTKYFGTSVSFETERSQEKPDRNADQTQKQKFFDF